MLKENLKNFMGKNMAINKIILIVILICANFYAKRLNHSTKEKIGQSYYLKRCSTCHGSGNRGGNLNTQDEWEEAFKDGAKELYELHDGEENTKEILKYLKSEQFKKEAPKMLKFLKEFASDSEYIPTCY